MDGNVYNIGGECEKRNIDIVNEIFTHMDISKQMIEFVEDRKGHDWRYAVDITKIKNELGWFPKRTFKSSMGDLIK